MIRFSKEQIIIMHEILIDEHGGLHGIRNEALLESAINTPFQTFDGVDLYPTVISKAASLCYSLSSNHAFHDGNKRIGVLVMSMFLMHNGIPLDCSDDDLEYLGLGIASGELSHVDVLEWIRQRR
jgi:death-on-curing protein